MKRGPESDTKGLEFRYVTIAVMGHKGEFVFPMTMVCPCLNGSVLDTFKRTNIYWGEFLGIKVMSLFMRWCLGSKVELQVSSPKSSPNRGSNPGTMVSDSVALYNEPR